MLIFHCLFSFSIFYLVYNLIKINCKYNVTNGLYSLYSQSCKICIKKLPNTKTKLKSMLIMLI